MVMLQRASLMEEAWSGYRGGHFNGGRMVMLQVTLLEGKWSYRGSQFYGGSGHFTGVFTSMEGEWSSYGGGQFKGGRMVMLWRCPV